MKRSTPMKRIRLRARGRKPRKHVSDTFRKSYKAANPYDELALLFPAFGPQSSVPFESATGLTRRDKFIGRFNSEPAWQLHHILGGIQGNPRHDEIGLVIHLSETVHKWCERYVDDALSLCFARKIEKGEFDEARVVEVLGCDSFAEWISVREPYWYFVRPIWKRLSRLAAAASEGGA